MRKVLAILLISIFSLSATVRADEGMWLLSLIGKNYEQMKAQGFRLTPEDIYNINRSSLKDAVVGLGNAGSSFWHFCSGELISGEGLFSTNHHCGFGMIQSHSSVEHDYLRDGFWAYKKSDELPNEGITAQILVRMEDVTDKIVPQLNDDMTESERQNVIDSIGKIISDEASKGSGDRYLQWQPILVVCVHHLSRRAYGRCSSAIDGQIRWRYRQLGMASTHGRLLVV